MEVARELELKVEAEAVVKLLQSHGKTWMKWVSSYGRAKKVVFWDRICSWWRWWEDSWNDNKVFRTFLDYYMNFMKCRQDLKVFTLVLKKVLWIKCYQTALHATEKCSWKEKPVDVANVIVVLF